MSTILPTAIGAAQLMPGCPAAESGESMPLASWYRIRTTAGAESYVAVSPHGVYRCNPLGRIHDFFECLYERHAIESQADALLHIGFEVSA